MPLGMMEGARYPSRKSPRCAVSDDVSAIACVVMGRINFLDRLPVRREAELWRSMDRLDGILIGIAGVRGELVSQLIWTCSWIDRLEAIHKRLIEIDAVLDSLVHLD